MANTRNTEMASPSKRRGGPFFSSFQTSSSFSSPDLPLHVRVNAKVTPPSRSTSNMRSRVKAGAEGGVRAAKAIVAGRTPSPKKKTAASGIVTMFRSFRMFGSRSHLAYKERGDERSRNTGHGSDVNMLLVTPTESEDVFGWQKMPTRLQLRRPKPLAVSPRPCSTSSSAISDDDVEMDQASPFVLGRRHSLRDLRVDDSQFAWFREAVPTAASSVGFSALHEDPFATPPLSATMATWDAEEDALEVPPETPQPDEMLAIDEENDMPGEVDLTPGRATVPSGGGVNKLEWFFGVSVVT